MKKKIISQPQYCLSVKISSLSWREFHGLVKKILDLARVCNELIALIASLVLEKN